MRETREATMRSYMIDTHSDVLAIFTADWHLSLNKPLARAEEDWLHYQGSVLKHLSLLSKFHSCPIFVAGDVFDRWDSTAALINHTLWTMPDDVYTIPGNHDLPYHNYKELPRSAYWTLVEAKKAIHLSPPGPKDVDAIEIHPFPSGFDVTPCKSKTNSMVLKVALIHDYIWTAKTGYQGAAQDKRHAPWMEKLAGYDVAVFGDNHIPWTIQSDTQCSVANCGALIRRKAPEMKNKASVVLLHSNGTLQRHYLDTSKDQWSDTGKQIAKIEEALKIDLDGFIDTLMTAKNAGYDWKRAVLSYCDEHKLDTTIKNLMIASVEKSK